ncbi:MAG: insulinase family protein [Spirochaetales bacterium]|nr:insulinase family protein [Spirochaetales bacterium]
MKKKNQISIAVLLSGLLLFSILVCTSCTTPGGKVNLDNSISGLAGDTGEALLPLDPAVKTGILENGLTWYIRENRKPEGRASLRIIVKAGSILEDEDQQGIAHLVEHMAFNGTENFEKMELVNYLESIGMAFGPEINAYTSFDETVYMLEIPTGDADIIVKALLILEDWAHRLSMDSEEIDKERGVVREEWRLGRGASGRIRDQILPVILGGSRYADRLPIGKIDVIMNTPVERVRDFYNEWYRPELMAIVAVGDFDGDAMQQKIIEQFSQIPQKEGRPRAGYDVPLNSDTLVKVITDPEVQTGNFELSIKTESPSFSSREDYREYLIRSILWGVLNARLSEIAQGDNPPFIGAQAGMSQFVSARSFISYSGLVSPDKAGIGLETLLREVKRMIEYGILPEELERQKADHMSFIESAWQDRDNRKSPSLAQELVSYYLKDVFMPGLDSEYELFRQIIPTISREDVDAYGRTILPAEGRSLYLILPEAAAGIAPSIAELLDVVSRVEEWQPEPPIEDNLPEELMVRPPVTGNFGAEFEIDEVNSTVWVMENGGRIVYKKTDFMEDEILFQAFSPGGLSLLSDEDYHMGAYASLFLSESGLAGFSASDLGKILAGKDVSLQPYIGEYFEGFYGQTSPGDLESLFQLLNLYFTAPGFSEGSFENVKMRLTPLLENRLEDPQTLYQDRLNEIISSGAFRAKPLDPDILKRMDLTDIRRIYSERFSGPGEFTYLFVGNINPDVLSELILRYLPMAGVSDVKEEQEIWKDRGIRPPEGFIDEVVEKGLEPQSRVTLYFHGEGSFTDDEKTALPVLGSMLQTLLREIIREDLSGTYSIRSNLGVQLYPFEGWSGSISFGCDPERTDELSERVMATLTQVKNEGVDEDHYNREIEKYRLQYETGVKENSFWMSHLLKGIRDKEEVEAPLTPEEYEDTLRSVSLRELASRVYTDNYIRLVLVPSEDVF